MKTKICGWSLLLLLLPVLLALAQMDGMDIEKASRRAQKAAVGKFNEHETMRVDRALEAHEEVTVTETIPLVPHLDSAITDVAMEAFVLSNGHIGYTLGAMVGDLKGKEKRGYVIEEVNLDEGWYKVRMATKKEMQPIKKAPKEEKESSIQWLLDLLSPSSAQACFIGTKTKSAMARLIKNSDGSANFDDKVTLKWSDTNPNGHVAPTVEGLTQSCTGRFGWTFSSCPPAQVSPYMQWFSGGGTAYWEYALKATHDGYYWAVTPTLGVFAHAEVNGFKSGLSLVYASCVLHPVLVGQYHCVTIIQGF